MATAHPRSRAHPAPARERARAPARELGADADPRLHRTGDLRQPVPVQRLVLARRAAADGPAGAAVAALPHRLRRLVQLRRLHAAGRARVRQRAAARPRRRWPPGCVAVRAAVGAVVGDGVHPALPARALPVADGLDAQLAGRRRGPEPGHRGALGRRRRALVDAARALVRAAQRRHDRAAAAVADRLPLSQHRAVRPGRVVGAAAGGRVRPAQRPPAGALVRLAVGQPGREHRHDVQGRRRLRRRARPAGPVPGGVRDLAAGLAPRGDRAGRGGAWGWRPTRCRRRSTSGRCMRSAG